MRRISLGPFFRRSSYRELSAMEDGAYLTQNKASLQSLGTKYSDLYYQEANSTASAVECTFNFSNVITLNSSAFNSNTQVLFPIDQFISSVILHLRLPALSANQTLPRGWGYAFLNYIAWTMGASSTTQVVLQGPSIWQTIAAQCETSERRSELFRAAGEEQLGISLQPLNQDPITYLDAYVLLPLPFSTGCGAEKLPFDTTLLSNNITVQIGFNPGSSVYGGSDPITVSNPLSQFLTAEVMLRQGKLTNQAASFRQTMIAFPEVDYRMPFTYAQQFQANFDGKRESEGVQTCQVTLNSFANADLVGIALWAVKRADVSPTGGDSVNWANTDYLQNLQVTFNGSVLFRFPGKLAYRETNMMSTEVGSSQWLGSVIAAGNTGPFISTPKDMYMVYLDFSRARSACNPGHLFNVFRIPNQNLILNFNTSYGRVGETGTTPYLLQATYFYNGLVQCNGGTSSILIG